MKMHMFTILGKVKPDTENMKGLNLAVVTHTTVQVTELRLQAELHLIGHNMLYTAWTYRSTVYILYIHNYRYIMD
jgi:hypothetical protein